MITLNTQNLANPDIASQASKISEFIQKIEKKDQGFYKIIDDISVISEINKYTQSIEGRFDDIVILGIGGSALGTICLSQAIEYQTQPRLHVMDNIDPNLIKKTESAIDFKKTLFIVVTKSGKTAETLALYKYFRKKCKNFVFVSEIQIEKNAKTFFIPRNVSGRFSILTAASLLPAKLIGINIEALLKGARRMRDKFLDKNMKNNIPFQLAEIQYSLYRQGKNINVLMPYSQKLIGFASWYRQLLAESIGKEGKGITPISALGVTDQHSQLQLYADGPSDKLIIFLEVKKHGEDMKIPGFGTTFGKLMQIEKKSTEQSLIEKNRPSITIQIEKINEETLGGLLMLFEASIAFLGEFFNINAFDQPGVERSKELTKKALNI